MKMHTSVLALDIVLALTACAEEDGPGVPFGDGPQQIAETVCPKAYECCTGAELMQNTIAGSDVESCEEKTLDSFENNFDDFEEAIDDGRAAYHGDRLETCLTFIRTSSCPALKVVRKIRSPQTHGDDGDHGTSTCQRTFSLGPIFNGGCASAETPAPFTPRNCGQFAGAAAKVADAKRESNANRGSRR